MECSLVKIKEIVRCIFSKLTDKDKSPNYKIKNRNGTNVNIVGNRNSIGTINNGIDEKQVRKIIEKEKPKPIPIEDINEICK